MAQAAQGQACTAFLCEERGVAAAGMWHSTVMLGTSALELQRRHETFSCLFHSWLLSDVFVSAAVSNLGQWLSCVSWF